jgi:hypothetical protein
VLLRRVITNAAIARLCPSSVRGAPNRWPRRRVAAPARPVTVTKLRSWPNAGLGFHSRPTMAVLARLDTKVRMGGVDIW